MFFQYILYGKIAQFVHQSNINFRFKGGFKNYVMEVVARIHRYVIIFDVTKCTKGILFYIPGLSLKCYVCDSSTEANCVNKLKDEFLKHCTVEETNSTTTVTESTTETTTSTTPEPTTTSTTPEPTTTTPEPTTTLKPTTTSTTPEPTTTSSTATTTPKPTTTITPKPTTTTTTTTTNTTKPTIEESNSDEGMCFLNLRITLVYKIFFSDMKAVSPYFSAL